VRLFVALELPPPVVAGLVAWGREADRDGLRRLAPASLHVTLAFLGSRPDEEAEAIGAATVARCAPVGGLSVGEPAWLGRGSALALDLVDGDGACARVQRAVAEALTALGVYEPDERPFRPHVTVARVRRGARVRRRSVLPEPPDLGIFAGTSITLFESRPTPQGADYRRVTACALPSS
jgi:2'-5' RNA ligase